MNARQSVVDWPRVLEDIAYRLGDEHPANPNLRVPCGTKLLAKHLGTSRGAIRNWLDGGAPKHHDGEHLIDVWCALTGKARTFLPREARALSAARA